MTVITKTTFPRSQHWIADGFRISVLLYKSHRYETCRTCGQRGAIHAVWTDTRPDGISGHGGNFCDDHRPVKGTLPDLDYYRYIHAGKGTPASTRTTERLTPDPAWPCTECGQPSIARREVICDHCTDPAHYTVSTVRVMSITADGYGERTETSIGHEEHTLAATFHCEGHRR
ncbi:hypothetical protein [Trebonia sp.]|uniref:hypothetical protein n=1 Tax=Trebonia sp. TaxID=2767075 RepID=UPI00261113C8|nr:hypothetical protein [Trebonia sp.]